jgi:hypothetical protein
MAAMRRVPTDTARLPVVPDGWTDRSALASELANVLAILPPAFRGSLRLAISNTGSNGGAAQYIADRLGIPIVAPTGPWTPGIDARGYAPDATGNAVWAEPRWTTYRPNVGPRLPLNPRLRAIYDSRRWIPGGVLFDGATPNPTLTVLELSGPPDLDVFSVTITVLAVINGALSPRALDD